MHHLYPSVKGDPLCPLGFHPQVRWPTRCKRCFRDYKEHGGRKKDEDAPLRRDDTTASSPSLSSWGRQDDSKNEITKRSWISSSSLAKTEKEEKPIAPVETPTIFATRPASWTSTPDLGNLTDDTHANIPTVSLTLPRRKITPVDTGQKLTTSDTVKPSLNNHKPLEKHSEPAVKDDTSTPKAKKTTRVSRQEQSSAEKPSRRIQVKELKAAIDEPTNHDVQFLIQVKSKTFAESTAKSKETQHEDDVSSVADTETTDTTLVDRYDNELQEQIDSLKQELDSMKMRCEKAEREKSDIMLRRLATYESTTSKTTASEMLKLQQRCNDLQSQLEDLRDDKKSLSLKVRELETELDLRPSTQVFQKVTEELKSKLNAAETLCEELMDENEDMKKEMRDLEEEMEEMQDNFREDQADEYTSLKKELEQTTKNCRILSFKLRKTERKVEQVETEKSELDKKLKDVSGSQTVLEHIERIKHLEQELSVANEVSHRLQKDLEEANQRLTKAEEASKTTAPKKKAPMLAHMGKASSTDGKVSRESLTRGGSQDDPVQLLRDLQDSLEREADLREQLKFAEEEAQNLRKKASRVEDDNESLVLQLKKMATKARSRKLSPSSPRLMAESSLEKDEGIADDEDPAELRLLLELSEQESSVLRRKVEELEQETEATKQKLKDAQEKLTTLKVTPKKSLSSPFLPKTTASAIQDQRLKVLEDETCDLRKKLIEKERDCERLHAELSVNQKRSKSMQKSKSLDGDQQTLDLRRQLQVVEQEAIVLRSKLQSLEVENEKLITDNKRLLLTKTIKKSTDKTSTDKSAEKIATLETELEAANKKITDLTADTSSSKMKNDELNQIKQQLGEALNEKEKLIETIESLKADSPKSLKPRTPKRPTDLNTKLQLKNMVLDLEKEIGETLVVFRNCEKAKVKLEEDLKNAKSNENAKLNKTLDDMKLKVTDLEKTIAQQKQSIAQEENKSSELNSAINDLKNQLKNSEAEKEEFKSEGNQMKESKSKLEKELNSLQAKLELASKKKDENTKLQQTIEKMKTTLQEKETSIAELMKDKENLKKIENEKTEFLNTLNEKNKKLTDVQKELKDIEEKLKKNEKLLTTKKDKLSKAEKELETAKQKFNENEQKWTSEKTSLELSLNSKDHTIEELTAQIAAKSDITESKLAETVTAMETLKTGKAIAEDKLSKLEVEKISLESKLSEMETNLQAEKKKFDRMKINQEKEQKNRELELNALKDKIHSLESKKTETEQKQSTMQKQEFEEKISKLEKQLGVSKQEYEDLTAKYEILEEEHVMTKAQLVTDKETVTNQLLCTRQELSTVETELRTLRDTYNIKNDSWVKEKLNLEERFKDLSQKLQISNDSFVMEKTRMKLLLDEKITELDQLKRESEVIEDQLKNMRKENEDLKQKLDDFDKVTKIHRNISADSSAMDKELSQLKTKLTQSEKVRKMDLAACKMRYENQMVMMNEELQSLQAQVSRFKKERDTFKHMLEGAQKALSDLKSASRASTRESLGSATSGDESEETKMRIATLEQQISCMEDELSEARLESSKLKTELVSERSSWEVKLSEMRSRINELEEERLLSSGRTKIAGLRTRMELAWQKEREEQQRLLQETSTLARDLRQTLFEVERERDKERLEAKRKQDQLKRSAEEEQEENRKKLNELQCDLLELRDAHAKLRTTNEKLRREKERNEKEREEFKSIVNQKRKTEQEEDKRMNVLLEQVETLLKLMPMDNSQQIETPTPPRRTKGPRSRESSPSIDRSREPSRERSLGKELRRLKDTVQEARKDRTKWSSSIRRASSTEHESEGSTRASRSSSAVRNGSLKHRSLSLEQTNTQADTESGLWRMDDDSLSSMQSLDAASDLDSRSHAMDSRLSGGSTQSEMITGTEKKKKKGFLGKLKKLTKSRSIDAEDYRAGSSNLSYHTQGSDSSINEDQKGSKRDLKDKLTGIFKRGGSSSRSNSLERRADSSSLQRPLTRSGSNHSMARPSPARSDTSSKYK